MRRIKFTGAAGLEGVIKRRDFSALLKACAQVMSEAYDAAMKIGGVILAGGASSRMGVDKASQVWRQTRAIDQVFALAQAVGADPVIVAGGDYGLPFVPDPPGPHGPAAGVASGCAYLKRAGCQRALILAVDAPSITSGDLTSLLSAPSPGAGFVGLPLPMVVEIAALPADMAAGWPLRRLVERAGLHILPSPAGAALRLRGANTPEELAALQSLAPEI